MLSFFRYILRKHGTSSNSKTIIYVLTTNQKGHQVSGYIDFADRLSTESFAPYFGKKQLIPKVTDLSYYNWESGVCTSNHSGNYIVGEREGGMWFKNKRDRKEVEVDPRV